MPLSVSIDCVQVGLIQAPSWKRLDPRTQQCASVVLIRTSAILSQCVNFLKAPHGAAGIKELDDDNSREKIK